MKKLKTCIQIISPPQVHCVCVVYPVSPLFVDGPWVKNLNEAKRCMTFTGDIQRFFQLISITLEKSIELIFCRKKWCPS